MVQMKQVLSRSMHRLTSSNISTSPSSMHRLASLSQPLLSFMASGTPRWWPSSLSRPSTQRVSRFLHGSRDMARSTGVKSGDLGEADTRQLNPSTNDFIIPLGKGSAITQDMNKAQNIDTTNKLITRYSHFPHANSAEDYKRESMNAISDDEDAWRTALEVDSKPDASGEIVDLTGCNKLSSNDKECLAAEIPDDPMDDDDVHPTYTLPYSSHRDGSIYEGIDKCWKREFCIADRNEKVGTLRL